MSKKQPNDIWIRAKRKSVDIDMYLDASDMPPELTVDDWRTADGAELAEDATYRLEDALGRLTDRQLLVYNLYYEEGHTQQEIADMLDVTQQAVEQILRRVRNTLQCNIVFTPQTALHYEGGMITDPQREARKGTGEKSGDCRTRPPNFFITDAIRIARRVVNRAIWLMSRYYGPSPEARMGSLFGKKHDTALKKYPEDWQKRNRVPLAKWAPIVEPHGVSRKMTTLSEMVGTVRGVQPEKAPYRTYCEVSEYGLVLTPHDSMPLVSRNYRWAPHTARGMGIDWLMEQGYSKIDAEDAVREPKQYY